MKKFYAVPENQAQLQRCITRMGVKLQTLELKIKELEDRSAKFTKTTDINSLNLKLVTKIYRH